MGLAASQSRFLFLTARKADCELGLAIGSNRKMAISREMSELTRLYNSKLESKQITFKNGSEYQKINYQYLMGYGARYTAFTDNKCPIKKEGDYNTVLTDYNGRVVIANDYVKYFAMAGLKPDAQGRGQGFGEDKIAELILIISNGGIMPDNLETTSTETAQATASTGTETQYEIDYGSYNGMDYNTAMLYIHSAHLSNNSFPEGCMFTDEAKTSVTTKPYQVLELQKLGKDEIKKRLCDAGVATAEKAQWVADVVCGVRVVPKNTTESSSGNTTAANNTSSSHSTSIEDIIKIHNGGEIDSSFAATVVNTRSGNVTGSTTVNNSSKATAVLKQIIDFYWPIFQAAATNGWTTEYNQDMGHNEDFISDALVSGTFCLADVNESGGYDPDDSLSYFCANGVITARNDSEVRAKVQAWYDSEKANINAKETMLDLEISDLSTELEAIKTEMQSVKSIIEDAENVFDWGKA